jgi:uncharacterized protein with WD repeat
VKRASFCAKGGRAVQERFVTAGLEVFAPAYVYKQMQAVSRRKRNLKESKLKEQSRKDKNQRCCSHKNTARLLLARTRNLQEQWEKDVVEEAVSLAGII